MSVQIRSDVQSVIDGNGAVLLDLAQGTYFSLNGTAAEIWLRLERGESVHAIEDHISRTYAVPLDIARVDVSAFLEVLVRRGLVDGNA
jgi:hypothetical protein